MSENSPRSGLITIFPIVKELLRKENSYRLSHLHGYYDMKKSPNLLKLPKQDETVNHRFHSLQQSMVVSLL